MNPENIENNLKLMLCDMSYTELMNVRDFTNNLMADMHQATLVPIWLVSNKEWGIELKAFRADMKSEAFKYASDFILECENDDHGEYCAPVCVSVELLKVLPQELDRYMKLDWLNEQE